MPRYSGTTTQRGLGWAEHQQPRQTALATMPEGALCARCASRGIEHPMTRAVITRRPDGRYVAPMLHLDDFPGRAYGGPQVKRLSWAACNTRAGQAITTAILRARGGLTPRQQAAIRMKQQAGSKQASKQAAASTKAASRGIARQPVKATTSAAGAQLRTSRQW